MPVVYLMQDHKHYVNLIYKYINLEFVSVDGASQFWVQIGHYKIM